MDKNKVIEIVRSYCALLQTSGISINKAFLYGSYASGNARPDSDIDLMIISPNFDSEDDAFNIKAWSITRKVDPRIEPFTVGLQRFLSDDSSPLLQLVKEEGIEIDL